MGSFLNTGQPSGLDPANVYAVKILERIRRALKRLNERFIAGTTGGTARDVSMIEGVERQQFQADEDESSK